MTNIKQSTPFRINFPVNNNKMTFISKKTMILLLLGATALGMLSWFSPAADDGRNLKVLPKDISSDSLERIMDGFVSALNVDCAFCHAAKDPATPKKLNYASDANHLKDITRTMMRMTNEMNEKYMRTIKDNSVQLITCNTCHKGAPVPGND